jgi:hypothetical protein
MKRYSSLKRMRDITSYFSSVLETEETADVQRFEVLLDAYLELKKTLASEFQGLAKEALFDETPILQEAKLAIQQRMLQLGSNNLPDKYLKVRGYGGVHPPLLQYLARHIGSPVTASKLRVLTGDQVHTERRVRELRDLGFTITAKRIAGENQYVLAGLTPDIGAAALTLMRKNILDDGAVSNREKEQLLEKLASLS